MSDATGNDVFTDMMHCGYIDQNHRFKQGMLMNDEGKRLFIKQVFPKKSPNHIDVYMQYAHVVSVNGQLKSDPVVVLGFDLKKQEIHPVLYRNDLLDHTIQVYENGILNEANAEWLLTYWSDWFKELVTGDYDQVDQAQLMAS